MIIPRENGNIPITISTANAVEALFNENETSDFKYENQTIWFNLRTIFRNIISSINSETEYDDEMVASDILEEISIIIQVLNENNITGKNKVTLYANSHNSLSKLLPNAKIKNPKTDKQIKYFNLEKRILKTIIRIIDSNEDYTLKIGDCKLSGNDQNAIVMTHHPLDLLSRYSFSELVLLESHTGTIKRQSQWNTKLTNGKNLSRMPFNSLTLQVFGDNSTNFYSYSVAYKKALTDLARKANWNSLTGSEKLLNDLVQIKITNPVIYDLFEKIVSKKLFF